VAKSKLVRVPDKMAWLLSQQSRFLCAYGGRSSAKSWSFGLYPLVRGVREKLKIVGMRETMNSIKDSSYTMFCDWIAREPYLANHYTVEATRIYGANGTEILFKGLKEDTANRIKSLEGVDICFVDEAQQVSAKSWSVLIPTIRKPGSKFLIAWNPLTDSDPVWQEFCTGKREDVSTVEINYTDNPFCSPETLAEAEACKRSDLRTYNHIWLGKPMDQTDNQLIPTSLVLEAQQRVPVKSDGPRVLAVDVARFGDDDSAFVIREDNDIIHWETHNGWDGVQVRERAAEIAVQFACAAIVVDTSGMGGPVFDELKRMGLALRVVPYSGAFASRRVGFRNLRADSYVAFRDWLAHARIPNDPKWLKQAVDVHFFHGTDGKMVLESKDDLKARGGKSPDVIDAAVMSLCHGLAETKKATTKQRAITDWRSA